jgi:hypothetical protein
MDTLKTTHILMVLITGFLLYRLMGSCSCSCGGNGFRVGGQSDSEPELCYGKNKTDCDNLKGQCKYYRHECHDICVNKDICHNGDCKIKEGGGKECKCLDDYSGDNCETYTPHECINWDKDPDFKGRKGQSCQTKLDGCCTNLGGFCKDPTCKGYGTCTW